MLVWWALYFFVVVVLMDLSCLLVPSVSESDGLVFGLEARSSGCWAAPMDTFFCVFLFSTSLCCIVACHAVFFW